MCWSLPMQDIREGSRCGGLCQIEEETELGEKGDRYMPPDHDALTEPFLLTIPQAAKCLGISRAMVYSLIAKRKGLPVIRLGRSIRVPVASLRKWIEEQEQEQQST